ncbi:MAG: N-acetyltransferase [Dehalococcoidia bacterium]
MAAEVVALDASRLDTAGDVLARAFFDDPLSVYLFPDDAKRLDQLRWLYRGSARYAHRYGETYVTPAVEGVALWLPPERPHPSQLGMIRVGMGLAPLKFGLGWLRRSVGAMNALDERHKLDVAPRHWYLFLLGVDTSHQRQGIGGRLIEPVLARAAADGVTCYLDTTNERNVAFYRRHGFQVVTAGEVPDRGPRFWTMTRAPID